MRNPTAPMLLLQVALESLGNLVGGGRGSSESWASEWNNRANLWGKGLTLGQLPFYCDYPSISHFPSPQKVWVGCPQICIHPF